MKKYSSSEQKVVLQSQLYTLDTAFAAQMETLQSLSDQLPGVILVNDMAEVKNTYMNKVGRGFLEKTQEELSDMGSDYFTSEMFCKEEMLWVFKHFKAITQRNDSNEVTGFYQKVRPDVNKDWGYFYLTGKLMEHRSSSFIYMSIRASDSNYMLNQIGKTLSIETPEPILFQKFLSLTKREKEILSLIAKGYTNIQMSDMLFVAQFTIETHRKNINRKLGTKNLRDLIRIADKFSL